MTLYQVNIHQRLFSLVASMSVAFLAILVLIFSTQPAAASSTITVLPGESIQESIDSAKAGDTILISAGAYTESLVLNKAVSLTGVNSATTIIQAPANSRVISVGVNVDSSVVISGLAITGGNIYAGAGLYLIGTPQLNSLHVHHNIGWSGSNTPTVDSSGAIFSANILNLNNSLIEENTAHMGSAILAIGQANISNTLVISNGSPLLSGVVIVGNATIDHSRFENSAYGILLTGTGSSTLHPRSTVMGSGHLTISYSSVISNNRGILAQGNVIIVNSRISSNGEYGGLRVVGDLNMSYSQVLSNSNHIQNDYNFDRDWLFSGNQGGGIYVRGNAWITGSLISNNKNFNKNILRVPLQEDGAGGGGIYVSNTLRLVDSIVTNNETNGIASAGGGIRGHRIFITDSLIMSNTAKGPLTAGGGAFGEFVQLSDSIISGNFARLGGGIGTHEAVITNSEISHNSTFTNAEEARGIGGGFYFSFGTISQSTIFNNLSSIGGGGHIDSSSTTQDRLKISSSDFKNNSALAGGGLYVELQNYQANLEIEQSKFIGNKATAYGGGILFSNDRLDRYQFITITNSIFFNNSLSKHYLDYSPVSGDSIAFLGGSDISRTNLHIAINHVTFFSDQPKATASVLISHPVKINMLNSAVVGYETGIENHGATITETHNFFSNTTNLSGTVNSLGGSLFDLEPRFVNPAAGDFSLQPSSSLIDAAQISNTLSTDFAGNVRPFGNAPDIGAFEYVEHQVTITISGTGGGFITGLPGIVRCETTCTVTVPAGTDLTLEAHLAPDSTFNGWSLPCDVSTVCQFIVYEDIELAAEFIGKDNPNALNHTTYLPIVTLP